MTTQRVQGFLETVEADSAVEASSSLKVNTAILRVAYLIAASDKDVNKEEREVFKKTLCALQGNKMGDDDTTEIIENVVEDARKFAALRNFYSEEELIKAFMSKVMKDVIAIQGDKVDCRKAFAIWTSICMADNEYSNFERKLVKGLQAAVNGASALRVSSLGLGLFGTAALAATAVGGAVFAPVAAVAGMAVAKKASTENRETPEDQIVFGDDAIIPDAFLVEVEERCAEIDEAQSQLASCKSEDELCAVKTSLSCLIESFKEFIVNVEE